MNAVPEIDIRGYLEWDPLPGTRVLGQTSAEAVSGRRMVEAVEAARRAGAQALLVVMEGSGGGVEAAFALYDALRAFSRAGGKVVVYLPGEAGSSYAFAALAGDYVLLGPGEEPGFYVHGPLSLLARNTALACVRWEELGRRGRPDAAFMRQALADLEEAFGGPQPDEAEAVESARARILAIFKARTATPARLLEEWVRLSYEDLDAPMHGVRVAGGPAFGDGWADGVVASLADARELACLLARGGLLVTPRQRMLAGRPELAPLARPTDLARARAPGGNKLTADALQTSNYAQDASGNPTAGAKLATYGTALKVAPANFQIGQTLIRDTWFANQRQVLGRRLTYASGAWTLTSSGLTLGTWNATNKQLRIWGTGAGAAGFNDAVVHATRIDGVTAGYAYELRSGHLNRGSNGTDVWFDVELWRMRAYWDEMLGLQTVCESVDWPALGASAPWFDISVTFFNGSPTWRWPWQ